MKGRGNVCGEKKNMGRRVEGKGERRGEGRGGKRNGYLFP